MTDITEGTWFAYQLQTSKRALSGGDPTIEKYTILKIEGDNVTVQKNVNGEDTEKLETKTSFGSYIFDMAGLEKRGSDNMNTQFGHIYANIFESVGRKDGSERIFLGKDNIVFRQVVTKKQPDGSLYSEDRNLMWSSMKI